MAVIPVKLDDIVETKPVPVGKYPLLIAACEEVVSKKGKPQFDISIGIEGHEDAANIRHFISLPAEGDEARAFRFKALMLKRFCALFGQPLKGNEIDTTAISMALPGQRATADVTLDKEVDSDGNEKVDGRVFNRLVVPQLSEEAASKGGRVAPPPPKR